jgi:hypothetical protein
MGRLGYLSQAATPAVSASQFCGSQCKNTAFVAFLNSAISSRYLPANPIVGGAGTGTAGCPTRVGSTGAATAAKITKVGSSAAGLVGGVTGALAHAGAFSGIFATGGALSVVPVIGVIAAAALGVVAAIEVHHAQAEAAQSSTLCTNVPVFNALLAQMDQELADGTATAADAQTAYQNMMAQFVSSMKADPSYKTGDAMWGYVQAAQAVLTARIADLQNGQLTGGAPAPFAGTAGTLTSAVGLPPAALLLGALAAFWFLL